jgi:hypothetical protein
MSSSHGTSFTGARRIDVPALKPAQPAPVESTPAVPESPYGPGFPQPKRKSLRDLLVDRNKPHKPFPLDDM